jgi:hypothetical protein
LSVLSGLFDYQIAWGLAAVATFAELGTINLTYTQSILETISGGRRMADAKTPPPGLGDAYMEWLQKSAGLPLYAALRFSVELADKRARRP